MTTITITTFTTKITAAETIKEAFLTTTAIGQQQELEQEGEKGLHQEP